MKKRKALYITIFLVVVIATITAAHGANQAQPGSEFDPLVTKSYVDEQIQLVIQKIGSGTQQGGAPSDSAPVTGSVDQQIVDNLRTDVRDLMNLVIDAYVKIQSLEKQNLELIQKVAELEKGFIVVEASKGQKIRLGAGTEVLIRSGETRAIQGELGGLADATAAADLTGGTPIPNQHLLISARNDGRGIEVLSEQAFMMIRGSYNIE
jgi:hypothetical protein